MREVVANDPILSNRRAYFEIKYKDGTPVLGLAGRQPEYSLDGDNSWNTSLISVLVETGSGLYYADLNSNLIQTVGTLIQTRVTGSNFPDSTGTSFVVVDSNRNNKANVGEKVALSYSTILEADIYFDSRLSSDIWMNSNGTDKLKALKQATRLIDRLNFAGEKADLNQLLEFPRKQIILKPSDGTLILTNIDADIPTDIKIACFEIAFSLLDGFDIEEEIKSLQAESHGYSSVKTSYNRRTIPDYLLAGIPSYTAWTYLAPYLRDPNTIKLTRIN